MVTAQMVEVAPVAVASASTRTASRSTRPSWRRPDNPTGHDSFRQIFLDHWHHWCDLRLEDEVPPDQRAYVCEIMQRLLLCREPDAGYARYVCPGCEYELRGTGSTLTASIPKALMPQNTSGVASFTPHWLLHTIGTTDDSLVLFC